MTQLKFKTTIKKKEKNYAEFVLSPLNKGYGHTLGNALRRTLLTSITGAGISQIKINGVRHQFSTLKGLKEDIVEFCLNIKEIRIKIKRGEGPFKITLDVRGPKTITAADIKTPAEVEIVNKKLVLGHLADKKSHLKAEMKVERGVGYQPVQEKEKKIGVIPLDVIFTPILKSTYEVKPIRVGQRTDFDQLILKVWTDGTIDPREALEQAAKILSSQFQQIYAPSFDKEDKEEKEEISAELKRTSVEEIVPTRIANALAKAGFNTIEDLLKAKKEDLLKVKNFGEKSLTILKKSLKKKGIEIEA